MNIQQKLSKDSKRTLIGLLEHQRKLDDAQLRAEVADDAVVDDAQLPDVYARVVTTEVDHAQHLALHNVPQVETALATNTHKLSSQDKTLASNKTL